MKNRRQRDKSLLITWRELWAGIKQQNLKKAEVRTGSLMELED